ncbi:MAG: DUF3857 domain-containing protein [Kiritimatiellae bacterium]|nr:DUF3857 domain-containing protein [Kiritimatiellia bacterium]
MKTAFSCILLLLSIGLCAAEIPDMPAAYRADPSAVVKAAAAVTPKHFPDADRAILDDRIHVAYETDGTSIAWDDEWLKVLTEKGRREASTVSLDYSERYGDAKFFLVEIIGTNGQARAVDFARTLKVATDNSSLSANIVDPLDKVMSCTVSGLAVGEIRHIRFARRVKKARMANTWADLQSFEYTCPIVSSVYTIDQPDANPVRHATVRHPFGKTVTRAPDRPLGNGRTLLRWDVRDVPQAFPEPDMPPLYTCTQALRVSNVPDWQTVSRWYWAISAPHLAAATPAVTNEVRRIVKGCATDEEKVRALFKFVSQEIRYMGLTMEDGSPGYEPHDVNITFDNRYGVCRDKAALLVEMLRIAGFSAYPVLIHVGAKLDTSVPWPFFNHAIVAMDDKGNRKYRLMDPTNESTHDLLPAYLSDRSYLVARPDGETLLVSPVRPASENTLKVESEGTLDQNGSLLLSSSFSFGGINDSAYRQTLLRRTPKERLRLFENFFRSVAPGAELLSFDLKPENMHDTDTPLSAKTIARIPEAMLRGETRDTLSLPFLTKRIGLVRGLLDGSTALEKRRFPLKISTTAGTEETLRIKLGDAAGAVERLPPPCNIGTNGYRFAVEHKVENGVLAASRKMYVEDVNFDVPAYHAVRRDRQDSEAAERANPVFAARANDNANIHWISDRTVTHFTSPTSWTTTNTFVKEVLTYKGKKNASEMEFDYSPSTRSIEVVEASVSNRNGVVRRLADKEINLLDAGWAASAPRYPASKKLMVNLPGVEIGSVIRATVVKTVTNAPVPYTGFYTLDAVDPEDLDEIELHVPAGMRFKITQKGLHDSETNGVHRWSRRNPPRVPDEPSRPSASRWRPYVSVSAADWRETGLALVDALARARSKGSRSVASAARNAVAGCRSPQDKITAIRRLMRRVRTAGPGLFELPFDIAFTAPDRAFADGYASSADRMNIIFAMLEAVGFDPSFALVADDARDIKTSAASRRKTPKPETFGTLLVSVEGKAEGRTFWIGSENEFTPPETSSKTGCTYYDPVADEFGTVLTPKTVAPPFSWWSPRTWFASMPSASTNHTWCTAQKYVCKMSVRENGAVDFDVESFAWGAGVGTFRKAYSEVLPEMRSRFYQKLISRLAQNATATRELETDLESYPAKMSFSAYAEDYAVANDECLTVRIPDFDEDLFDVGGPGRKSPISISGKTWSLDVYEIVFPEGYAKVEHVPQELKLCNPLDRNDVWLTHKTTSAMRDGRLVVTVKRMTFRPKAAMLSADYHAFLRDWNRRAASAEARTVSVRKGSGK